MSKTDHKNSAWSYTIGFVLCLVLTTIAYQLVVNKTFAPSTTLATIVGLATLQVLIQVFFFLHLGRGPKPLYNIAFFAATVGIIIVVVGGSLFIMSNLHYNMLAPSDTVKQLAEGEAISQVEGTKTGACETIKTNHKVTITANTMSPLRVDAQLCDTLSFVNQDDVAREVSFGTPTTPVTYAGETKITIRKGKSETITLNQAGTYSFFSPLNPKQSGSFSVK